MEEIQAEKKSLEEERVRSQEMMEQLMRMQQAMEKNGGQLPPGISGTDAGSSICKASG